MERAADLVVSYGSSLSGEHSDEQSRGELLNRMFGAKLVGAFGELKQIFDSAGNMNPGKVIYPAGLTSSSAATGARQPAGPSGSRTTADPSRRPVGAWASAGAATTTTTAAP